MVLCSTCNPISPMLHARQKTSLKVGGETGCRAGVVGWCSLRSGFPLLARVDTVIGAREGPVSGVWRCYKRVHTLALSLCSSTSYLSSPSPVRPGKASPDLGLSRHCSREPSPDLEENPQTLPSPDRLPIRRLSATPPAHLCLRRPQIAPPSGMNPTNR